MDSETGKLESPERRKYVVKKRVNKSSLGKKLLCESFLKYGCCKFNDQCTYAHGTEYQSIDDDKYESLMLIVDDQAITEMNNNNDHDKVQEIYQSLLRLTNICTDCVDGSCIGGYNCRFGASEKDIKICKQDYLSGNCENNLLTYTFSEKIADKMGIPGLLDKKFHRCRNGQHITKRGFIPFYIYINSRDDSKNEFTSVRKIELDHLYKYLFTKEKIIAANILNARECKNESDSSDSELSDIMSDAVAEYMGC